MFIKYETTLNDSILAYMLLPLIQSVWDLSTEEGI
jgi:hypothetical protein